MNNLNYYKRAKRIKNFARNKGYKTEDAIIKFMRDWDKTIVLFKKGGELK